MTTKPEVSVVMSVCNGADSLHATMDSILSQQVVDFELVVVNDGSTDNSGAILDDYAARSDRVRLYHQANTGLTKALARGCSEARGEFIARHDAGGDISLPGRLSQQRDLLRANRDAVMVSCGSRIVGPQGEMLYEVTQTSRELMAGLDTLTLKGIRGPSHHGSVLFRKDVYERLGGYRAAFKVAQDLDLWLRMAEVGQCLATPEIAYVATLNHGSISATRRREQLQTTRRILAATAARRAGLTEVIEPEPEIGSGGALLRRLRVVRLLDEARLHCFMGSCLRTRDPGLASQHFRQAIHCCAIYPRAWIGLLRTRVLT